MYFSEKLRKTMESAHVNQGELAKATGASVEQVNRWITGNAYPKPEQLLPIAQHLRTTLEDLCEVDSWSL